MKSSFGVVFISILAGIEFLFVPVAAIAAPPPVGSGSASEDLCSRFAGAQ
jgi:hypothetical protein